MHLQKYSHFEVFQPTQNALKSKVSIIVIPGDRLGNAQGQM